MRTFIELLLGIGITFPFWAYFLAKRNTPNKTLGFVFDREGEAMAVVKGGQVVDFIGPFKDWRQLRTMAEVEAYNWQNRLTGEDAKDLWDYVPAPGHKTSCRLGWCKLVDFCTSFFGVRFVGLPPFYSVWWYWFDWTTTKQDPASPGGIKEEFKHQLVPSAFLKTDKYWSTVPNCWTNDTEAIQVEIKYYLGIGVRNPYKVIFGNHKWVEVVLAITDPLVVRFVGDKTFNKINAGEAGDHEDFSNLMKSLNQWLLKRVGVEILFAKIMVKNPTSETGQALVNATSAKELAIRRGEASLEEANYAAQAKERLGDATAYVTQVTKAAEAGGVGALMDAQASGVQKIGEALTSHPNAISALEVQVASELARNPATKTMVISGDSGGVLETVTGLAQAFFSKSTGGGTGTTGGQGGQP